MNNSNSCTKKLLDAIPTNASCSVQFMDREGHVHWIKIEGSYAACLTRDALVSSGYKAHAYHGTSLIL